MTINSTTAVSGAPTSDSTTTSATKSLGKDAFMQLLITKLENQDPTQPQDDSQMLAQLAQFSTLEQMQQMNDTLTKISDFFTQASSGSTTAGSTQSDGSQSTGQS
jgi:flagellar basal-body rod modification protein FlgD